MFFSCFLIPAPCLQGANGFYLQYTEWILVLYPCHSITMSCITINPSSLMLCEGLRPKILVEQCHQEKSICSLNALWCQCYTAMLTPGHIWCSNLFFSSCRLSVQVIIWPVWVLEIPHSLELEKVLPTNCPMRSLRMVADGIFLGRKLKKILPLGMMLLTWRRKPTYASRIVPFYKI